MVALLCIAPAASENRTPRWHRRTPALPRNRARQNRRTPPPTTPPGACRRTLGQGDRGSFDLSQKHLTPPRPFVQEPSKSVFFTAKNQRTETEPISSTRCWSRRDQAGPLCFSSIKVPAAVAGSRNTIGRPLTPMIGSPAPSTRTPDSFNRPHIALRSSTT